MTTTYKESTQVCCLCSAKNTCTLVVETQAEGSADLDLRPPPDERDTMSAWLQQCDQCHYVGVDLSRESEGARTIVESDSYRKMASSESVPRLARRFALCSELMLGIDRELSATALLRSAWVCDDHDLPDLATDFRNRCAELLWKMQPFEDNKDQTTTATVLIDVLRRSGEFEKAGKLAAQLLKFKTIKRTGVMKAVVRFQQQLIRTQCRQRHTVEQAMEQT